MKRVILAAILAINSLAAVAGPWIYNETKDEMRGTSSYYAELKSTNTKEFSSPYDGGSSLTILIASQDDKNIAGVLLVLNNGRIACQSSVKCAISMKFDDGEVINGYASPYGSAGNALKIEDTPSFAGLLKEAKGVFVEIPVHGEGRVQFKFSPEPFKYEIPSN